MDPIVFKRWSNKPYAILCTFHRIIRIGTLALCYTMLQSQPVLAQADSISPRMFFDLEEVETIGEQEAELYSPQLRQLLLVRKEQLAIYSSRSLPDLLDFLPGVDIRTRGPRGIQSDLSVQGGTFDQSLVLLNGIDMSDPQTGHFSLDLPLSLSNIHQLEVLKGPASKKYGLNSYTGAINVLTQPRDSLGWQADAAYGAWNTHKVSAGIHAPFGKVRTMISGSTTGSDGYTANTDFRSQNLYFHSNIRGNSMNTDMMFGWNQKEFGANAFYTPRFPEQFEETSSFLAAMKFESKGNSLRYTGNIHWKKHNDHFLLFRSNPAAYENYHMTDVAGGSLGARYSSKAGVTDLSLKYRYEQIYSTNLGALTQDGKTVSGSDGASYSHFSSRDHLSLSLGHLLKYRKWYINGGLLLHAGIKDLAEAGIYPGIDVSYEASEYLGFFLSVNRSMRLPTFTDLYYQGPQNLGNPNLKPEKAISFESGARFSGEAFHASLAGYYRAGKESIDWIWMDSLWQTMNFTNLHSYGFEASLHILPEKVNSALGFLQYLDISYSFSEIRKVEEDVISNYVLDYLKHKLSADMMLDLPGPFYLDAKLQWQDRAGSFQYYSAPESTPLETLYEPFWLLDLQAGIKIRNYSLFLDATNLLNTSYRDIGSVVMPGRWIMAGVRILSN